MTMPILDTFERLQRNIDHNNRIHAELLRKKRVPPEVIAQWKNNCEIAYQGRREMIAAQWWPT